MINSGAASKVDRDQTIRWDACLFVSLTVANICLSNIAVLLTINYLGLKCIPPYRMLCQITRFGVTKVLKVNIFCSLVTLKCSSIARYNNKKL